MSRAQTTCPVRFVSKRWSHHSAHSGYDRIVDYMGTLVRPLDRTKLSSRWIPDRVAMRFVDRAKVRGYDLDSFYHEWKASRDMFSRLPRAVYHVLYGDDMYRYLWMAGRLTRHRLVVSYHLPPNALRARLGHTDHLRRADAIVVVGTNLVPLFSEICGSERVHYIPHGIDTEVFRPSTARTPEEKRERHDVLFVGSHRRDVETLRQVVTELGQSAPDIRFVLITAQEIGDTFRTFENVVVKGYLSEAELIRQYQESALVLQPMEESTANNSILEGLACGTPIVATDVGGVGAYVNGDCAVLTRSGDAEEMIAAIESIVRDPARRGAMGDAAREQALEFSWPKIASQFAELYDRIC